ncbi:MAG: hypothetical protein ACI9KE_004198 [Polyangiales bacterium]|jgi:hypothetical protein
MRRSTPASDHTRWLIAACLLCVCAPLAAQGVERRSLSEGVIIEAGDSCMTTEPVIQRLRYWLSRDELDASIRVVVRPGARAASFSFQRGDEAPAERHFDVLPQECAARLDAVTLAIALAIDPSVLSALPPEPATSSDASTNAIDDEPGPTASETEGEPVNQTVDQASVSALDTPPEPVVGDSTPDGSSEAVGRYALVLGGGAGFGVVPGVSAIGSLSFEIMLGQVVTLRVGGFVTARTQSEIGRGEVGFRIVAGRLDGCGGWTFGIARGDICLGLGAGAFIAEGSGFTADLRASGAWLAGIGRVSITLPADSRVGVRLVGDGIVPFIRPRVHVSDDAGNIGPVRALSAVSAMLSAEFLVRWP